MKSATLMSAVTTKNLRSMRLNTSIIPITKVRITIQITRKIKITRTTVSKYTFNKNNNSNNSSNNGTTSGNFRNKGNYTEIPSNVEVTLKGPVNQDQLAKIKEILKNPWIYKDKVQKNQYPALGE